jgi:hypothetical protein
MRYNLNVQTTPGYEWVERYRIARLPRSITHPIFHTARHKLHLEHVCIGISQHQTTTGTRTHVPLALTCFHDDIGVCVLSAARPRDLGNGLDHIVKETHDSA